MTKASLDDTLTALVTEAGADRVQKLRGAPFDAARAQRLFDVLTGRRELTPPPAPRAPELSDPPAPVAAEPLVEADLEMDVELDGLDEVEVEFEDDFVEIDDLSLSGSTDDSEFEGVLTAELLVMDDDGVDIEAADELAADIEELASMHGMKSVLDESVDHESIDDFFGATDGEGIVELDDDDDDDGDDDTGTVQVKLPEEHEAVKPDREKSVRSSVKKLFRK